MAYKRKQLASARHPSMYPCSMQGYHDTNIIIGNKYRLFSRGVKLGWYNFKLGILIPCSQGQKVIYGGYSFEEERFSYNFNFGAFEYMYPESKTQLLNIIKEIEFNLSEIKYMEEL